ncbi:MAG TPA: hypothetical protein VKB42_19835 [Dongiaceae bacterium]|nr:hypothetical protein [Dongiaceae bacterium]
MSFPTPDDIDAEALRRMLRAGGLEVTAERAGAILPVALALLKSCDRLASLDIEGSGGSGIAQAPDKLA